jgi:hypothetical protein
MMDRPSQDRTTKTAREAGLNIAKNNSVVVDYGEFPPHLDNACNRLLGQSTSDR